LVVDLTAEFPELRAVRLGRNYLCLPILDGAAPDCEAFTKVVRQVADWPGVVYIHCASGHGRSALLSASVLIMRGWVTSPADALAMVRAARPSVRLSSEQRALLAKIVAVSAS
jgi:protein-tyrosine phosphatase